MRVPLSIFKIAAPLLVFAFVASAQQTTQTTDIPRDSQGVTVLSRMMAATAWTLAPPQDAMATGTIIRYRGDFQDSVSVTLKAKGPRLYRADVQDPTGTISTIVNGDAASVISAAGIRTEPFHSAIAMRPAVFPFFAGLTSYADQNIAIAYGGTETIGDQACYRVGLSRPASATDDALAGLRSQTSILTIWISAASGLPTQIEYIRIASDNPTVSRRVTRRYSDYRTINNIAVPFHQEQYVAGQIQQVVQLDTVVINNGLSDADFVLPPAQE